MRVYLNAGFGEPIGADDLSLIGSLGFAGVRQDVPTVGSVRPLVMDLAGSGLRPSWIVPFGVHSWEITETLIYESARSWSSYEFAIEIGSEEDLRTDAGIYARGFADVEARVRGTSAGVQLVTAGISTTSRDGLRWLGRILHGVSEKAIIGYHTYRRDDYPSPYEPQRGFRTRSDEFEELRKVVGGRRIWNTEIGWHTAKRKRGCWIFGTTFRLSDTDVAHNLSDEMRLNDAAGAEVMTVYQLNDGPNPDYDQDRYGIRAEDGSLRPQAFVVQRRERWA